MTRHAAPKESRRGPVAAGAAALVVLALASIVLYLGNRGPGVTESELVARGGEVTQTPETTAASPTSSQAPPTTTTTTTTAAPSRAPASTRPAVAPRAAPAADRTQAAVARGWGAPVLGDEFDGTAVSRDRWALYDGAGHNGLGVRSPGQASVANGVLRLTGDDQGTTAGMSFWPGQQYGRWEVRMRVPYGHPDYHPVLALWPISNDWPGDGEVDFAEMAAGDAGAQFNYLAGASNTWTKGYTPVDITQWHNYAVEWTPQGMRGFIDGREVFVDDDVSHLPPGPMYQTIQLDWIPAASDRPTETVMDVDWVRIYAL
ncbi:glycoside hydrolase family 16 protein [Pseudonocardia sp. WMMC193]|uniref:glycoside hydrolase family 16 protein n=1 Tax=Pseudonocardia sp. WMMC193 TaxID=2911965 RepID=UPI001F19C5EE|nr:glycoside hydrolase family 16 protein [Pseudonocardia sp. WMMC193]MCF7553808.1 glycoside hydrolase family 16 protein [Pseudonocardia sp. WMMC193]